MNRLLKTKEPNVGMNPPPLYSKFTTQPACSQRASRRIKIEFTRQPDWRSGSMPCALSFPEPNPALIPLSASCRTVPEGEDRASPDRWSLVSRAHATNDRKPPESVRE